MTYPPVLPPKNRTETTAQSGNHAEDHNLIAAALEDVVVELGPSLRGGFSNLATRLDAGGIGPGDNAGFVVDPEVPTVLVVQPGGNAQVDPVDADVLVITH